MQKKILVVDDEEDLTWSISKNLTKDKDIYDVMYVNSAQDALNVLSQVPVDLVVSDIKMPGMSGLELLVKIKELYATTKVIIMTAFGNAEVQKEASDRGSLYYIEKPFEIEDLRTLIHKAITEKKGFDGKVSDFQLSDLIQMNVLGRMVIGLVVTKGDDQGIIYFNDGNIVHAVCGKLSGEDAFYRILGWENGKFEFRKGEVPDRESITKGWQSLLLEGMRRKDEVTPESKTQLNTFNRQEAQEKIKNAMTEFIKIKGVDFIAITDEAGFSRASMSNEKKADTLDVTILPTIIPAGMEYWKRINGELKGDGVRIVTIELNHITLFMAPISGRAEWIFALCQPDVNLGGLRLALKKQSFTLGEVL